MSHRLNIVVRFELEKMIRKRSTWWIMLAVLAVQIAAAFFEYNTRMQNNDLGTGFQVAVFSLKISLELLSMILLALSAMSLSEEITTGTARLVLVRGVKRRDFILGKFIALLFFSMVLLLCYHLAGLLLGACLGGLKAIKEGEFLLFTALELTKGFLGGMGLTFLAMTALVALGCFISILAQGSGGAVGMALVTYFVMQIVSQMGLAQNYLFPRYLLLPVENMAKLSEGIYVDWTRYVYWTAGVSLGSALVFIVLAIMIFNRRDVWH